MLLAGLALTIAGCATVPTPADPASEVRRGRFALSGEALKEPVSGRFELVAAADSQRFWLIDPLGVVRAGLLKNTNGWQPTDAQGRLIQTERLAEESESGLGLPATEWPRLARALDAGTAHLLQKLPGPFVATEATARGSLRLRLLPD